MQEEFVVLSIARVLLVDETKYENNKTSYNANLLANELIYRPSGYSAVHFGGQVLHTGPNSVYFLPKGNGERYDVEFSEPNIFIDVFFYTDIPLSDKPFVIHSANSNLGTLFNKIFTCWVKKKAGYRFKCLSLLYQIFAELLNTNYIPKSKYEKIEPAVKYIDEHFNCENISCEKLSELCGIHYSYLQRLFNQKFGMPPQKYILQMKINYACELLESGMYTVAGASVTAGFTSVYYFSRIFKKFIGISPREYKQIKESK